MENNELLITEKQEISFKTLQRRNRRRNMFFVVSALQIGSLFLTYYLGRTAKGK